MLEENVTIGIVWNGLIGTIAVRYGTKWRAYRGVANNPDEKETVIQTAKRWAPSLAKKVAVKLFPQLNPKEYAE